MNMSYIIEKGIPVASMKGKKGRSPTEHTAAIRQLEVGESVMFPTFAIAHKARVSMRQTKLRFPDREFVSRRLPDGTYRFWRTA